MLRTALILATLASLLVSASAAAFDETRDDFAAPRLHFRMAFGGSATSTPAALKLDDGAINLRAYAIEDGIALNEAGSAGGLSTGTWVGIGVLAVAAVVVVASHHGGGGGGGGGGY